MNPKLILVVDDDLDTRFVFGAILNHDGYAVVAAENGAEGVAGALRHRPDLILMDVEMPVMDGFTAARRIRAAAETATTPMIVITCAVFDAEQETRAHTLFDTCLTKPVQPRRVLAEVLRLIGPPGA